MEFEELLRFVAIEDEKIKNRYKGLDVDSEKRTFARAIKLQEEVGELSEAILTYYSLQRKDKLDKKAENYLEEEFADVILTTLIVARSMDVDIRSALKQKMEKMSKRN